MYSSRRIDNIVVFMPRYLGDCINCTPALQMLKNYYPQSVIHLVIRQPLAELFCADPRIKPIFDEQSPRSFRAVLNLIRKLKSLTNTACMLITNTFMDALIAKVAGIPIRIGYDKECRKWLLTESLPYDRSRHYINRYAYLANLLCDQAFRTLPDVKLSVDEKGSRINEIQGLKIGFAILSKAKLSRHYPPAQTAVVIQKLQQVLPAGTRYFMLGNRQERSAAQEVVERCRDANINSVENLAGMSGLSELINDVAALDVLISVDSGPLHVAAATNTLTVALHSKGTSPFSTVCPKGPLLQVVNSRGRYINDEAQVLDLLPRDIVDAVCTLLAKHKDWYNSLPTYQQVG